MRGVIALLVILTGMAVQPALAAQPAGQPYHIGLGGWFVTQVMIDGQGPFSFIIDTASSRTLMYDHVRTQLKLAQSQPGDITVYGINESAKATPVKPTVLEVAGRKIQGLTLGVLPPNATAAPGIDGILGIDVLSRYFVVLDRTTMRLILLTPDSDATQQYHDWSDVALTPHPLKDIPIDFWYMTVQVNMIRFSAPPDWDRLATPFSPVRLTALFDLGASITMMNWPAAEQLGVREKDYHLSKAAQDFVRDVFGSDEPALRIERLTIALGPRNWSDQTVLAVNSDVFVRFDLDNQPAMILSAALFYDRSLAIDFAGHRLFIGPVVQQTPRS